MHGLRVARSHCCQHSQNYRALLALPPGLHLAEGSESSDLHVAAGLERFEDQVAERGLLTDYCLRQAAHPRAFLQRHHCYELLQHALEQ